MSVQKLRAEVSRRKRIIRQLESDMHRKVMEMERIRGQIDGLKEALQIYQELVK